jgi:hypothetical protein
MASVVSCGTENSKKWGHCAPIPSVDPPMLESTFEINSELFRNCHEVQKGRQSGRFQCHCLYFDMSQ